MYRDGHKFNPVPHYLRVIGATTRERIITVKVEEWSPLNDE